MTRSRPHQVEVISVREQALVALLRRPSQCFLPPPGLSHDLFGQIGMKDLVPSHHDLVILRENLLQALIEVCLQVLIILHAVGVDEFLNFRIRIPLLSVDFVPSDVEIGVGKSLAISAMNFSRNL